MGAEGRGPEAHGGGAGGRRGLAIAGVWHVHASDYASEALQRGDVHIRGVWDEDASAGQAFAAARGLRYIEDLDDLLGDPSVEGVIVTCATASHPYAISRALEAGKHVFSEKVLAIRPDDALALATKAAEARAVLYVSFQRLAETWVRTVDSVVHSGRLGQIVSSRLRFQHAGIPEGWLPAGFVSPEEAGGGAVIDLGIHGLYLSQLFHGAFPKVVMARLSHHISSTVEDDSVVLLEYADGSRSVLETSLVAAPNDARWAELHGVEGSLYISPEDQTVFLRRRGDTRWVAQPALPAWPRPLDDFLDVLARGGDAAANVLESLRLVSLVSAAYQSARSGAAVEMVDPAGALRTDETVVWRPFGS